MDYWFFLSYARSDGSDWAGRFFDDLVQQVRGDAALNSSLKASEIGFFDKDGLQTGTLWEPALVSALRGTRTLVCLYSRAFFTSPHCGKEYQLFLHRLDAWRQTNPQATTPLLILPVIFGQPLQLPKALPAKVASIQFTHGLNAENYQEQGLKQLIRNKEFESDYLNFLASFSNILVTAVDQNPLLGFDQTPLLEQVVNAFSEPTPVSNDGTPQSSLGGPRLLQVVYCAGLARELPQNRLQTNFYAAGDPGDWQPFAPVTTTVARFLTQKIATEEELVQEPLPLDDQLIPRIRKAEENNNIVIVIIDPWSVRVERLRNLLADFDQQLFKNCALIVPWNRGDQDTVTHEVALRGEVTAILDRTASVYFFEHPQSRSDFEQNIRAAIHHIRRKLLRTADTISKAEGSTIALPSVSTNRSVA
jgi:FxsC-like protein